MTRLTRIKIQEGMALLNHTPCLRPVKYLCEGVKSAKEMLSEIEKRSLIENLAQHPQTVRDEPVVRVVTRFRSEFLISNNLLTVFFRSGFLW